MRFALASENSGKEWSFEINMSLNDFIAWVDTQEYPSEYNGRTLWGNHYSDFVSEQEQYGVLDLGGSTDVERYHSYEIEEGMFPVILENFRQWFKERGLPVKQGVLVESMDL